MYLLTIVFGPSPTPWAMLFKDEELAKKAFADIESCKLLGVDTIAVEDEFGQRAVFGISSIHGAMLEDLDKSKISQIERGLHMARIQAKAQQMAQRDPLLQNIRANQGPSMIDPMGMSNGRLSGVWASQSCHGSLPTR